MKQSGMQSFATVLRFEFTNYLKNKVYVITTLVFVVLIALLLSLPALIGMFRDLGVTAPGTDPLDDPTTTIYVIQESGAAPSDSFYAAMLEGKRWEIADPDTLSELRTQVSEGNARAVFVIHEPFDYTYMVRRAGMTDQDGAMLQAAHDSYFRSELLSSHGLSPTEIETLLTPTTLTTVETVADTGRSMAQAYLYTYLLLMLLYMTVMMYGQMVATSVASEKSNRTMEILITSVRPTSLMFGKVIGSGLAGLSQMGLMLLTAIVFYQFNAEQFQDVEMIRSAFEASPIILVYTVVFYLIGYFMYAFLYGALGSLASRTEDINTSIMPIVLLLVAAMFVSFLGMANPESTIVTVCSFLPFLSPLVLFVRILMTDVPAWQIALSMVIMLGTTAGVGWLSARIYRIGVLMYGKPPKLRELFRTLRNERRVSAR